MDVFDSCALVIDYFIVRLLISLAFGNDWELFHWDISVAFTNAKAAKAEQMCRANVDYYRAIVGSLM